MRSSIHYVSILDSSLHYVSIHQKENEDKCSINLQNNNVNPLILPKILQNELQNYIGRCCRLSIVQYAFKNKKQFSRNIYEVDFMQIANTVWLETCTVLDQLLSKDLKSKNNQYQYFDVTFGYLLILFTFLCDALKSIDTGELHLFHPHLLVTSNRFERKEKIEEYRQFLIYTAMCGVFGPSNARILCLESVIKNQYIEQYFDKLANANIKMKYFKNKHENKIWDSLIPNLDEPGIASKITQYIHYTNYDFLQMCCYCLQSPFVYQIESILQRKLACPITYSTIDINYSQMNKMKLGMLLNKCRIQDTVSSQKKVIRDYITCAHLDSKLIEQCSTEIIDNVYKDCLVGKIIFGERDIIPSKQSIQHSAQLIEECMF